MSRSEDGTKDKLGAVPSKPSVVDSLLKNQYSSPSDASLLDLMTQSKPKDKYHFVYLTSSFLGIGTLLGYNILVTSSDYLIHMFSPSIMFWMVPVYILPDIISMLLMIRYGHRFGFRMTIGSAFIVAFLSLSAVPFAVRQLSRDLGYGFVLFCSVLSGWYTATIQAKSLAFTGEIDLRYTQANVSGQALAGIIACLLRVFTKAFASDNVKLGGLVYYIVGGVFQIICLLMFFFALRTPFVRHRLQGYFLRSIKQKMRKLQKQYNSKQQISRKYVREVTSYSRNDSLTGMAADTTEAASDLHVSRAPRASSMDSMDSEPRVSQTMDPVSEQQRVVRVSSDQERRPSNLAYQEQAVVATAKSRGRVSSGDAIGSPSPRSNHELNSALLSQSPGSVSSSSMVFQDMQQYHQNLKTTDSGFLHPPSALVEQEDKVSVRGIIDKTRRLILTITLTNVVTFMIFPGLIVTIRSQYGTLNHNDWMPVILLTQFNCCDFFGRQFVASWTSFGFNSQNLWLFSLMRLLLIYPVFVILYKGWIVNDYLSYAAMFLMAVSQGQINCLCFLWSSERVTDVEQGVTAAVISTGLVVGIVIGSYIALALSYIL